MQSRIDGRPDLKEDASWTALETRLRDALQMAADGLTRSGRLTVVRRDTYFASLTEKEIYSRLPRGSTSAEAQVVAFVRETVDDPHLWSRSRATWSTTLAPKSDSSR